MPGTVAVIGHGPSPEGRGWGALIDACDFVIRMWDCHWQPPADYGRRYDVGIFTVWQNELDNLRAALIRNPGEWWGYDHRGLGRDGRIELLNTTRLIDPREWVAQMRESGAHGRSGRLELTRGTAAVLAALGWMKPTGVRVVGFDAIAAGMMPAQHYARGMAADVRGNNVGRHAERDAGSLRSATHDWLAERVLILAAVEKAGAQVFWGF